MRRKNPPAFQFRRAEVSAQLVDCFGSGSGVANSWGFSNLPIKLQLLFRLCVCTLTLKSLLTTNADKCIRCLVKMPLIEFKLQTCVRNEDVFQVTIKILVSESL